MKLKSLITATISAATILVLLAMVTTVEAQVRIIDPPSPVTPAGISSVGIQMPDWFQLITVNTGAPVGTDCDAVAETGRHHWDSTNDKYYVCSGVSGWIQTAGVGLLGTYWTRTGTALSPTTAGDTLGTTGARLTAGWFLDLASTNPIAGSITGNAATVTFPITVPNGGLIQTTTTAGNTFSLSGYTGSAYSNLLTITNAAVPTIAIPVITGNTVVGTITGGAWSSPFTGVTRTATSSTITLTAASTPLQSIVPGAAIDLILPTAAANMTFTLHNSAAFTVTIKDASAATVGTLTNGQTVNVVYDGTNWLVW